MDNRTDFRRPRGPAFLAEQARRALALPSEIHELGDVPLPLVHTALGIAVCAIAVLLRPQAVGLRACAVLVALLAAATVGALTLYDRLVYAAAVRPGIDGAALPVVALIAFECVLGGTESWPVRLVSAVTAALIIGGVPRLGGLRAEGREWLPSRVLRDGAGIAALLPPLLVGAAPSLQWWPRGSLVLVVVTLVTVDTLRTEGVIPVPALVSAAGIGGIVAAATVLATTTGADPGVRAALLLVVWYGLRGMAGGVLSRPRRPAILFEYLGVVAIALAALQLSHR